MKKIEKYSFKKNEINTINQQMEKCVCKIYNGNNIGTGFFIKIKTQNNTLLPVLVTNNHILNGKDIEKGKEIVVSINNEDKYLIIDLDNSRIAFTDILFDSTFIQIKEDEDKFLNTCDYLEIDERIYNKNLLSENESLYILHYPKGIEIVCSQASIVKIDNNKIKYKCKTDKGSSGSPILSLDTCKVIGIHAQGCKNENNNRKGILINYPIEELKKYLNNTPTKDKINIYLEAKDIKENIINTPFEKENISEIKENRNITPFKTENINENINNTSFETENINEYKYITPFETKNINENRINSYYKNKIRKKETLNSMIIINRINKNKVKIFRDKFVFKNFKIIEEGNEKRISEMIYINQNMKNKNILKIKLKKKSITDMSYLFVGDHSDGYQSLIKSLDIDNLETNIRNMIHCCESLTDLHDIDKWNIQKYSNGKMMFHGCNPSLNIPNESKNGCYIY